MDIKNLFGKVRDRVFGKTIASVSLEDLERERCRLRGEEEKLCAEIDQLDGREKQLLAEGRATANVTMQKRIAGKIKDCRDRRKNVEQIQSIQSKSLRIVTGLHTIKENEKAYANAGLGGVLAGIPIAQIVAFIEKAPAGAEATMEGMQDILESLGEADAALEGVFADPARDSELDDIMSEFAAPADEQARAGESGLARTSEFTQTHEPKKESRKE